MATQSEDTKSAINTIIFTLSKAQRSAKREAIEHLAKLTGQDPESFFENRQGKHWQVKKQAAQYHLRWRATGEELLLTLTEAAKYLKFTEHQVVYRCAKGKGSFELVRLNHESSCDDILTVTKVCE